MNVLVTGGAGFIGSHAALALLRAGHRVLIVDDLSRGHRGAVDAARRAIGPENAPRLTFLHADLADTGTLRRAMSEHQTDTVLHFAALAYVGESVVEPLRYYRTNVAGAISLIEASVAVGVQRLILSSTTATYGEPTPDQVPIVETHAQAPINPYGASKLMVERILLDVANAQRLSGTQPVMALAFLRYFNVAGCDRSGVLGEHHAPETHLIPLALGCLLGTQPTINNTLTIYGQDYPTPDGTCIRDYIHVDDLVEAHLRVLDALRPGDQRIYNLGLGRGISVREILGAIARVTGREVPAKIGPRRPGDPGVLFADPTKIKREIGWEARVQSLDEIIGSAWRWMQRHPRGYDTPAGSGVGGMGHD
jgi:UDP-glucose 4-epimerase